MQEGDGVTRWSTVDSSPQGGWDFVLHGSTVLCNSDLVVCATLANRLHDALLDPEEMRRTMQELNTKLKMFAGL